MSETINGDLSVRACVDTARMEWTASPSGSVFRKRVHLVGPPESGQVTSVVRYQQNSEFPVHDHPDGEEILVLDGVFSDEQGDWPAGTYLLNPEGYRHTPSSKPGCLLFVKLRQFPGQQRRHVAVDTTQLEWQPVSVPGVTQKPLYQQPGFDDSMRIVRWDAHTDLGTLAHQHGAELFVLEGTFSDEAGTYGRGCWLRLPVGYAHRPRTAEGCTLYVKTGGHAYLRSPA